MAFSPNNFFANINGKDGLARPSRFQVILPIPEYVGRFVSQSIFEKLANIQNVIYSAITDLFDGDSGDGQNRSSSPSISRYLSLQCDSAELPGKSMITADVKIYGPTFRIPYQSQYQEMTLTFICTNDFYERKLFDRWLECIMPTDTNNLRYAKDDETRYLTNITVIQYDEFIKQIYAVELIDAYPTSVSAQALSWSDENYHRLTVQFSYSKYRVIYKSKTDVVGAVAELLSDKLGTGFNNGIDSVINKSI